MNTENTSILQLQNLSIGYKTPLLSGINAIIEKGEIVLLAGKNGCGKTTLLKSIYKELSLINGNITVSGFNISKIPVSEIGKLISVVLSRNFINSSLRVIDLISLGRYPYKKWYQKLNEREIKEINSTLDLLDLERYRNYYVSELSDGNLQKVMIARALVQDCPLLILDEPTSHLDISNKLEVMRIINYLAKERGKAVLLTSHDLNLGLSIADKLWFIKNQLLYTGFTEDLAYSEDILNYFSGNSVEFSYTSNEYIFSNKQTYKKVRISGNIPSCYWLKKALIRNQFIITDTAQLTIEVKNSIYILIDSEKKYSFSSIEEIINYLKK